MPVTIYIPQNAKNSGISITYTKTKKELWISGWYDSMVGIEGQGFTLRGFFEELGISKKDCLKVWEEKK